MGRFWKSHPPSPCPGPSLRLASALLERLLDPIVVPLTDRPEVPTIPEQILVATMRAAMVDHRAVRMPSTFDQHVRPIAGLTEPAVSLEDLKPEALPARGVCPAWRPTTGRFLGRVLGW